MTRWEYVRLQLDVHKVKSADDTVDRLGREGWELVGVVCTASYVHMWFKRALNQ